METITKTPHDKTPWKQGRGGSRSSDNTWKCLKRVGINTVSEFWEFDGFYKDTVTLYHNKNLINYKIFSKYPVIMHHHNKHYQLPNVQFSPAFLLVAMEVVVDG